MSNIYEDYSSRKLKYYMVIADAVSTGATCDRAHVGAVIVLDGHIVATGYNGSAPKLPHCDEVGHDMENEHCVRTIHAEENAIIQAASRGAGIKGADCFCTLLPCFRCARRLYTAGIRRIIFRDEYTSMSEIDGSRLELLCRKIGFSIHHINSSGGILERKY